MLKYLLGGLHDCGAWHEIMTCPICRAELNLPPEKPPRPIETCSFTPNRICDQIVKNRITEVGNLLDQAAEDEAIFRSKVMAQGHRKFKGKQPVRRNMDEAPIVDDDEFDGLGKWRNGGSEYIELARRDM